MYAWASPSYLLDELSLDQLVLFHRYGWDARETDARLFWGVLGQLISGDEKKSKTLDEFKKLHPDAKQENGAWTVSR